MFRAGVHRTGFAPQARGAAKSGDKLGHCWRDRRPSYVAALAAVGAAAGIRPSHPVHCVRNGERHRASMRRITPGFINVTMSTPTVDNPGKRVKVRRCERADNDAETVDIGFRAAFLQARDITHDSLGTSNQLATEHQFGVEVDVFNPVVIFVLRGNEELCPEIGVVLPAPGAPRCCRGAKYPKAVAA